MSDPSALIGSPIALALLIVILTSAAVLVWYYRHSIFVHEPLNLATELRVAWYLAPYYVYLHSKRILGSWYKGRANAIDLIEASVKKYPTHTALVFASTGQSWTYLQMNADINKAANFLYAQGVRPGHVVALFIENSPQFIFAWLGLLKLGATAAFLNPNLQGASLVHVLKVSGSSKVIVQASPAAQKQLLEAVLELSASNEWEIYHFEDKIDKDDKFAKLSFTHIDMESLSASAPDPALKDSAEFSSPAMLIYTSGTTGLPKAAYISHSRFILAMCAFSGYIRITQADRLYSCLPLYHASAAMAGFGAVARSGATLILVPKFSARNFFPECKKYHVTMIHYIGELARFLISVPVNAAVDTDHHVKTAFGNGMRPDIWLAFKKRFGIKAIAEFYASTEGTAALANYQNNDDFGVGAMGRQGLLQSVSVPLALIRFDQVQEEPIRDAQGRCTRCPPNEVGELIGLIRAGDPFVDFKGYKDNSSQTKKKILTDVLTKGDTWFRTGDLIRKDAYGYMYFVDRIGDTFRWKGENVSTIEVSNCFTSYGGVEEANVYGVSVPNADGRAGMAALVVTSDFQISGLASHLRKSLPFYAVPVFLRFVKQMTATSTMKQVKHELVKEGIQPDAVKGDELWYLAPKSKDYTRFTAEEYAAVESGAIRL